MFPTRISRAHSAERRAQVRQGQFTLPAAGGASRRRAPRDGRAESGFTLAGLLVIMTVILIFIAYTVPDQWSKIMQREREKQTIFVMKQYARAISTYSKAHGAPTSLDQLKEARLPRVIRGPKGEWIDPLTGKVDWILIPPGAIQNSALLGVGPGGNVGVGVGPGGTNAPGNQPAPQWTLNASASPKDYVGPFIGVRPPIKGQAMMTFRGTDSYEQWFYTTTDLETDINNAVMVKPNP